MRLRTVLLSVAAILAGATLLLAGREVARRFGGEYDLWELLFAIFAVANAVVFLAVLDWVRNLRTDMLRSRSWREGEEIEEGESRVSEADARLIATIHDLEAMANEERGAENTIDEALRGIARLAEAESVDLWTTSEEGKLEHQAYHAQGETAFGQGPAEPPNEEALEQAAEHRKPFEAVAEDVARFLLPLVCNRQCVGVLKVVVPLAGEEEERHGRAQQLSAALGRLARPVARAVCAPGLYDQAVLDELTGLYTRRHFVNRLTEATGTSRRYGEPLSVVLMDVDNFGLLNSRYGHTTADRALQEIGTLVQDNIRESDSAYRYGADEFAILLPDTDIDRAASLGERLRGAIRALRPLDDEGGRIIATVSVGIAEFDEDMRGIGPLIAHAEEALYSAKQAGHDRIVRWSERAGDEGEEG